MGLCCDLDVTLPSISRVWNTTSYYKLGTDEGDNRNFTVNYLHFRKCKGGRYRRTYNYNWVFTNFYIIYFSFSCFHLPCCFSPLPFPTYLPPSSRYLTSTRVQSRWCLSSTPSCQPSSLVWACWRETANKKSTMNDRTGPGTARRGKDSPKKLILAVDLFLFVF